MLLNILPRGPGQPPITKSYPSKMSIMLELKNPDFYIFFKFLVKLHWPEQQEHH